MKYKINVSKDVFLILMVISGLASIVFTQPVLFFVGGGFLVAWLLTPLIKMMFNRGSLP